LDNSFIFVHRFEAVFAALAAITHSRPPMKHELSAKCT